MSVYLQKNQREIQPSLTRKKLTRRKHYRSKKIFSNNWNGKLKSIHDNGNAINRTSIQTGLFNTSMDSKKAIFTVNN